MTDQTTSQQASVAAEEGTLKRSIQMKMFGTKADKARVQLAFEDPKSPTYQDAAASSLTTGQIIGQMFAVKERDGTLPDGSSKTSLLAVGEFEAVVYATGEVSNAMAAYLPAYYLEVAQAAFEKGAQSLELAVEIVLVPTGKSIAVAYEVRNLIRRAPESALNRIKRELAAAGRLRLPAPVAAPLDVIEAGDLTPAEPEADDTVAEGEAGAEATGAAQSDGETAGKVKGKAAAPAA